MLPAGTQFDRQGNRGGVAGQPGNIGGFRISPDGRTVALAQNDGTQDDIWTIDLDRNVRTRLTSDPANEVTPVW